MHQFIIFLKEEYNNNINKARSNRKKNKKLLERLKKKNDLDGIVHSLHEAAFEKIDCLECANCCRTTSPIFTDRDIDRLSARFRIRPSLFIVKYLKLDDEGHYVLQQVPCPFLGEDNYCSVYEDRPRACREYPHTNRKNVHQAFDLTLKNAEICPAVARILDKLMAAY